MILNEKILYMILRYMLLATVIYLILRYTPYILLDITKAVILTFILIIFLVFFEIMYNLFFAKLNSGSESFNETCGSTCSINKSEPAKPSVGPNCRVVCDAPKVEGFAEEEQQEEAGGTGSAMNKGQQGARMEEQGVGQSIAEEVNRNGMGQQMSEERSGGQRGQMMEEEMRREKFNGKPSEEKAEVVSEEEPANDPRYYWGTRYGNLGYDARYGFGGMFYDEYPFYNRFRNNDYRTPRNIGADKGDLEYDQNRERREELLIENTRRKMEERATSTKGYDSAYQEPGAKSQKRKENGLNRRIEGDLDNELPYSDYNSLPVGSGYKSHDYEYGYSFLPPSSWYPQPVRSPICVTERRSPVMPVYTDSTTADLKEFYSANRVTPPDLINTDYIGDKLNAGR